MQHARQSARLAAGDRQLAALLPAVRRQPALRRGQPAALLRRRRRLGLVAVAARHRRRRATRCACAASAPRGRIAARWRSPSPGPRLALLPARASPTPTCRGGTPSRPRRACSASGCSAASTSRTGRPGSSSTSSASALFAYKGLWLTVILYALFIVLSLRRLARLAAPLPEPARRHERFRRRHRRRREHRQDDARARARRARSPRARPARRRRRTRTCASWCDARGRTPRADEQAAIAARAERAASTPPRRAPTSSSPTPRALMIAVYSEHACSATRACTPTRWRAQRRYDLTLLTALDLPWQRRRPAARRPARARAGRRAAARRARACRHRLHDRRRPRRRAHRLRRCARSMPRSPRELRGRRQRLALGRAAEADDADDEGAEDEIERHLPADRSSAPPRHRASAPRRRQRRGDETAPAGCEAKTASIAKKSATIAYQSSGMLKAIPARAAADQARPIMVAPDTKMTAAAIATTARKRRSTACISGTRCAGSSSFAAGWRQYKRERHAADPDDDGEQMNRLQGRIQHGRSSVRRGTVGALSIAVRPAKLRPPTNRGYRAATMEEDREGWLHDQALLGLQCRKQGRGAVLPRLRHRRSPPRPDTDRSATSRAPTTSAANAASATSRTSATARTAA